MDDWGNWVAISALVLALLLALLNRAHSERLFRRSQYPAVAWFCPEASTSESGTRVTSKIVNKGPRDILSISLVAFLSCGLRSQVWCQGLVEQLPLNDECIFTMTDALEDDIKERFGGVYREQGWRFRGKPKRFKVVLELSYIPTIAETDRVSRKMCCRLSPVVKDDNITEWRLDRQSSWRRFVPF